MTEWVSKHIVTHDVPLKNPEDEEQSQPPDYSLTDPAELLKYFDELPETLKPYAVIAGGAAVCLDHAGDVDIFLIGMPHRSMVVELFLKLAAEDRAWTMTAPHEYMGWSEEDCGPDTEILSIKCLPKGDDGLFVDPDADPELVNVIVHPARTLEVLLSTFDLSICRWAVTRDGKRIGGEGSTLPGEPVIVYKSGYMTCLRLEKYLERYPIPKSVEALTHA